MAVTDWDTGKADVWRYAWVGGNARLNALTFFKGRLGDYVDCAEDLYTFMKGMPWTQARFYAVQFAVCAIFCRYGDDSDPRRDAYLTTMRSLHLVVDDKAAFELANAVAIDGYESQEWDDVVRTTALRWLRVRAAARAIAEAYRHHLVRRRLEMIRMVIVPALEWAASGTRGPTTLSLSK